jgi:hypothetical protein
MTKVNLSVHQESCKNYNVMIVSENFTNRILELEKINKDQADIILKYEKIIKKNESIISQHEENSKDNNKVITDLKLNLEKNSIKHDEHIKLQVKYDELSKQHEKTIEKLELKISQCDTFIQNLAREASNKPTTTNNNNTINNSIRNHLSPTFTIDKLEDKKLEETMREHYTEFDYFCGQRGLATFLVERVIRTPDEKMMICCTDTSRKKFKILDMKGNLKEDIEARVLCEKIKAPTSIVTKEMYEKITNRIDEERKRLSDNDQSRKFKLIDDSMRAQQYYIDNMNFDDINYNGDFIKELCVLLNV